MTSALIELGIKNGYKIFWDCAKENIPSKKTADKLGFNLIAEYEYYHVTSMILNFISIKAINFIKEMILKKL